MARSHKTTLTAAETNTIAKSAIIAHCARTNCTVEQACRRTAGWDKVDIINRLSLLCQEDYSVLCTHSMHEAHKIWDEMLFIAMSETV